jgi:hypothetical protein
LRRRYSQRVTVEWIQAIEIYVPVLRFEVLIRRRAALIMTPTYRPTGTLSH